MSSSSLIQSSNPRITPLPDLLKLLKPFSPDKIVEFRNMLEDRERAIKKEWEYLEKECHSIKEECRILERLLRLANLDKKKIEENMIRSERECEELKQKITRLIDDEKFSSDRAKKAIERCDKVYEEISVITNDKNRVISELNNAEERCVKVYEELSIMATEKNKVICELNKNISMLNNQILERDQRIEMYQLKLMSFEERVAPVERELQELKGQKSAFDRIMEEMRSKQSEADQMVEELKLQNTKASNTIEGLNRKQSEADEENERLRHRSSLASETIGELRSQIIGIEMEKTRYDNTIKELKRKLSEVNQTVDELWRSNIELKRQKLDVEEASEVNTKKMESFTPIITRMKEGLANILNVEVQDMVNIIKSNERCDATPSSKGEKENLEYGRMHVCNGSLRTGSTKMPPRYSPIKDGNTNEKNAENNSTDQGIECKRSEGSDCIEVICVDDETSLSGSPNMSEKDKISEKFPLTSFVLRRKSSAKKWLLRADMLNDFQDDLQLCMNVVCVLYRQQISASESTTQDLYGGLSHSDALRVRALGEYLVDGGQGLRLGKSVYEVKQDRPDVLVECRRLATNYHEQLFHIYCNGEDPFFKLIKLHNL